MAIRMDMQTTPGGSYTELDLTAYRLSDLKLLRGYSQSSRLTFTLRAANHTMPIAHRSFLRVWDDDPTAINPLTSAAFSATSPLFEGFVEDPTPGPDGLTVSYVVMDSTQRAVTDYKIMSLPWVAPVSSGDPPTRGIGAIPRLVFNANSIANDEDAAVSRMDGVSVGTIIKTILDDAIEALRYVNCAPESPDVPYVWTGELDQLTFIPMEKYVFTEESVRSAIMRILQLYPSWRMVWVPGTRQFRFFDLLTAPAVDITLNDFTPTNPYHLLSLDLTRSLEDRYTSVRFYGPPRIENKIASTLHGTTGVVSDSGLTHSTAIGYSGGTHHYYTIDDPTLKAMAGVLAEPISVPVQRSAITSSTEITTLSVQTAPTLYPVLQARFAESSSGDDGWYTLTGWTADKVAGVIDLGPDHVIQRPVYPATDPQTYESPIEVRLIYGAYTEPYQVRYPTTEDTYAGTAYTEMGLENELSIYDEMLAVGWIYNIQITSATRLARFAVLAETLHRQHSDVIYTGGGTLERSSYPFAFLNRRVNLPAIDANGAPLTTGWEAIGAMVTDVEFDFSQRLTTIQFSTDQLALMGVDAERMKEQLKIHAATPHFWFNAQVTFVTSWGNEAGRSYLRQDVDISINTGLVWTDDMGGIQ